MLSFGSAQRPLHASRKTTFWGLSLTVMTFCAVVSNVKSAVLADALALLWHSEV
jgi:hypothetical protein